mgnify:CR=1 FL=1
MILALALVLATGLDDPFAPMEIAKLPSKPLDREVEPPALKRWVAQINVRMVGRNVGDAIITERWAEIGQVISQNPVRVRITRTLEASTIDGQTIPPPGGDPLVWEEQPGMGKFRDPMPEDPVEYRTGRLTAMFFPGTGSPVRWPLPDEIRVPTAIATSTLDQRRAFELDGLWGRRMSWRFEEQPGFTGTGEALFDTESGLMMYGRIQAHGVPLPGGDGTLYQLTWVRRLTKVQ